MAVTTVVKTIGTGGDFSTLQLWNDGAPANLVTAERSACGTFAVASFIQGESLTFVGSGATGKFLDTDSAGVGTGTYVTYGITAGNPATSDVITGGTSGATAILTSGTADFVGVIWEGRCLNQEFTAAVSPTLTITGSTSSVACYKFLTTQTGCSFIDNPTVSINPLRYDASRGAAISQTASGTSSCITANEANFRISKLQVTSTLTTQSARAISFASSGQIADKCIFQGTLTASGSANGSVHVGNGATPTIKNCLIIQLGAVADHIISTGTGSPSFFNCTIVAVTNMTAPLFIFSTGASGTITIQNSGLFAGNSASGISTGSATISATTCVSDISGTTGVTQVTYFNEYEGMSKDDIDYRLSRTSQQIDTGTTDSTNAAADIVGTTRPQQAAYDIGAWESSYTTTSNTTRPTMQRSRRSRAHDAERKRKGH